MALDTGVLTFDWKERPSPEDIEVALEEIGVDVHVYAADTQSDEYGYVFSKEPLEKDSVQLRWQAYLDTLHAE